MAVIADRLLDYSKKAENTFQDLDGQAYYADAVLRTANEGVLQGYDGKIRPQAPITREEAVSALSRALSVTPNGTSTGFSDNENISSWAIGAVAAFAQKGYVTGRPGNAFDPKANITRAEIVKMLDNMVSDYITQPGSFTPTGKGIVIVKASGVTLENATLTEPVLLGGNAGEVVAKCCQITGQIVGINTSKLTTETGSGNTGTSTGTTPNGSSGGTSGGTSGRPGGSSGGSSSGGGSGTSQPTAPGAYPLPKGQETSKNLGVFDYDMTYYVTLTAQEGADIYYEIAEGADAAPNPTTASKKFETYQYRQVAIEQPEASKEGSVEKTYNVKAVAIKNGKSSTVSNWNYTVTSNPHHHLKVGVPLDSNGSEIPNVTLIQDYDSDKIYFVNGTSRAMVLDAGYFDAEDPADLYAIAREKTGAGKPIDLVIGHPHPDHVQMAHQFLCAENKDLGAKVYVNTRGIEVLRDYIKQFGVSSGMFANAASDAYDAQLQTLGNGDKLDLGGTVFDVIELPGHQDAGIMLYDKTTGNLFTTDQIGNNRTHITDSFWMQFANLSPTFFADPMDVYQSSLAVALERLDTLGEINNILTGHNDVVLKGTDYINNLKKAVQQVVDQGKDALTPTLRTLDSFPGYLENTMTSVVGDRLSDVNWCGINIIA